MTDLLPLGIHFDLPEQQHHDDPGIGYTSAKALLSNPVNGYWKKSPAGRRVMEALGLTEPEREEESAALQFGTAAHVKVLQPWIFDERYIESEDAPPEYLTSKERIAEALTHISAYIPPRSANRNDFVLAAKRADLKVIEDWSTDFTIKAAGRTVLSKRWMAQLNMIDHLIGVKRADLEGKSIRETSLSGGHPEVTVIWEEDGVRMKMRVDYLKLAGMIDVKTYACPEDAVPVSFFLSQVARYGYDLQTAHYAHGWDAMRDLIAQGRVFGEVDPAWLKRLKTDKTPAWRWVAIQSMGMPEVDFIDFTASLALGAAEAQRRQAVATFIQYRERFGEDQPWVSMRGRIVADDATLDATGVARRMMERGSETWVMA